MRKREREEATSDREPTTCTLAPITREIPK